MKTSALTIGAVEAKSRFSDLIDRVGRGAEVIITKHGKPVARMVPIEPHSVREKVRAVAELRSIRDRYVLKGVTARALISEGRK
jgi:prevent-host-death family protein